MSYISWRKTNEDRVLQKVNDGELCDLPAWEASSTSPLTDTVISPLADTIIDKSGMIPIGFACVFGEYLFEEYNVSSADIELFSQVIIKGCLTYYKQKVDNLTKDLIGIMNVKIQEAMLGVADLVPEDMKGDVREIVEAYIKSNNESRDNDGFTDTNDGPV